jgi:flavin reductase (DIM6/NTAB) family NADH-FMN oxidoreductase RutF
MRPDVTRNAGMDDESYRAIMRHQAGAVAVIAVGAPGHRAGLTATAVCSLSDTPPTILVCVNRNAGAHDAIKRLGCFSVNLLASDQKDVAACFSGRAGLRGEGRFQGQDWSTLVTGAPVLDNALATLDCVLSEQHSFATHSIFIGRVMDARARTNAAPLLYFRGAYCDLGER